MYAEERQERIRQIALDVGRVNVTEVATQFGVHEKTIRGDLTALERAGVLRRVHGGAIPAERLGFEPPFSARDVVLTAEKDRIARAAVAELPEEGTVLIDAGTTTARLAEVMPTDRELTVVTNAVTLAARLAAFPNLTVLLLGGRVRGSTLASVDSWAVSSLADIYVDLALMGANGVSAEHGLTTPDLAEAAVKSAMVRSARRVVLLVDHTKVGRNNLVRFAELKEIDLMITDTGLDDEQVAELQVADLDVRRV